MPQSEPATPMSSQAGRCLRLIEDIAAAHAEPAWISTRAGRIARLTEELNEAQRAWLASLPADEQTDESLRGYAWS